MLKPDEIEAIRDKAESVTDELTEYLLRDITLRVLKAASMTSTAAYQIYIAELLGSGRRRLRKELQKRTGKSARQVKRLLKQAAATSYGDDIRRLSAGVPLEQNETVQQIIHAAAKMADDQFQNITQTLGFVDPHGHASKLTDAYRKCCDFAFNQVVSGAADANTAVRQATKNLADMGVRVIDYDSGAHTSVEAAVRRNVMGGLGLMQEQIAQQNHDDMGANGWEISAHAASAPDHEPIQGRQYTDAAYQRLNNSLVRRIGTLNCGHTAFPIVLGVSQPQYTDAQLEQIRQDNATGVMVNGRHYTTYEATQQQRAMERTMRRQKRRIVVDDAAGDKDKLLVDQIRLGQQNAQYRKFSRAAGLRTQEERADVLEFTAKQGTAADKQYKAVVKAANSMYNIGSEEQNVAAYMRDLPIRKRIQSDDTVKNIFPGQQRKHIPGTLEYKQYVEKLKKLGQYGPSRLGITQDEAQKLVDQYNGTGILGKRKDGSWDNTEEITIYDQKIGIVVNNITGVEAETTVFKIHYGKKGTHIVPGYPSRKGAKAKK